MLDFLAMKHVSALDRVRAIVLRFLRGHPAEIYLFGSYARQTARPGSDIDVGIAALRPLPVGLLPALREALEESTIPQRVDVVDLSTTSADFAAAVKGQGIKWSD